MDFQQELIAEYDRETAKTRKMLEAIPADADFTYKPHPKSMSLGRLAGHLAETAGEWATTTFTTDKLEFPADHKITYAIFRTFDLPLAAVGWYKQEEQDL
ncbi:MAG: hypothetical protein ABR905_09085 [Terracidiphilus sp.]|jgi:uncharacterized damage-inducible protein DinB